VAEEEEGADAYDDDLDDEETAAAAAGAVGDGGEVAFSTYKYTSHSSRLFSRPAGCDNCRHSAALQQGRSYCEVRRAEASNGERPLVRDIAHIAQNG
jgi:hypothetical protein